MSNLQPFQFGDTEIRFVGTIDNPEWVAADVIAVLYPESNPRDRSTYLRGVPEDWKSKKRIATAYTGTGKKSTMRSFPAGSAEKEMITVNEPGLYHLICRSNSPIAVPFQKWVFEEVLPSIRKTGEYSAPKPTAEIKLEHKVLSLPEAIALTDSIELVGDYGKSAMQVMYDVCMSISASKETIVIDDDVSYRKFLATYDGVSKYMERRDILTDVLLILPVRLEDLYDSMLAYLQSRSPRSAHCIEFVTGIPDLERTYREAGYDWKHMELLIKAILKRIQAKEGGRWINADIFQLND